MMTQSNSNFLVLFSFCKVIQGKEKSIICDFQKGKIKFIPNEMAAVIGMLQKDTFEKVKEQFSADAEIFDSYVAFLLEKGFAFFTASKDNFVPIENSWCSPEVINNAMVEYGFEQYDILDVLQQLDGLFVKFIEFRFTKLTEEDIPTFKRILDYCTSSVLRSARVYLPYESKAMSKQILDLVKQYPVIDCAIFYNSKFNRLIEKDEHQTFYIEQTLEEITKANVNRKFLVNNIEYFHEAQQFNPYYNKKVAITAKGDLKNCIKNKAVFGNLHRQSIREVVATEAFQEFWKVTHDQIEEVRDSELRYNYVITNDLEKINDGNYKIII